MVYTKRGSSSTRNKNTTKAERSAYVLDDADILQLARWASVIQQHYGQPMDIEWAKDGVRETFLSCRHGQKLSTLPKMSRH